MEAIEITEYGGTETMGPTETEVPDPGEGKVRIEVRTSPSPGSGTSRSVSSTASAPPYSAISIASIVVPHGAASGVINVNCEREREESC